MKTFQKDSTVTPSVSHLCSSILQDQVLDAGLDSDVGSDQQLQGADGLELLRDRETIKKMFTDHVCCMSRIFLGSLIEYLSCSCR